MNENINEKNQKRKRHGVRRSKAERLERRDARLVAERSAAEENSTTDSIMAVSTVSTAPMVLTKELDVLLGSNDSKQWDTACQLSLPHMETQDYMIIQLIVKEQYKACFHYSLHFFKWNILHWEDILHKVNVTHQLKLLQLGLLKDMTLSSQFTWIRTLERQQVLGWKNILLANEELKRYWIQFALETTIGSSLSNQLSSCFKSLSNGCTDVPLDTFATALIPSKDELWKRELIRERTHAAVNLVSHSLIFYDDILMKSM